MYLKNTFRKSYIFLDTLKDRAFSALDRSIRKPLPERNYLKDPYDSVSLVTGFSKEYATQYLDEVLALTLIDVIDSNLRVRLPIPRYNYLKNFKINTEWIRILNSVYVIIRILKPSVVVETGVGEIGMTSSYILAGLHENNAGYLYSIDPDKYYDVSGYHIGAGIPDYLKYRHKLVIGKSQLVMKRTLEEIGLIDLFLHDGDHRYKTKLFEYELAYRYMKNHGTILSDDTWDSAFDFFVRKHQIHGYSVVYNSSDYFSYSSFISD